jgi:hypothetical protein
MCISHLGKREIRVSFVSIVPRTVAGIGAASWTDKPEF